MKISNDYLFGQMITKSNEINLEPDKVSELYLDVPDHNEPDRNNMTYFDLPTNMKFHLFQEINIKQLMVSGNYSNMIIF